MKRIFPFFMVLLILFSSIVNSRSHKPDPKERMKIIAFLNRFQEGYSTRDLSKLKQWAEALMTKDVIIIGTNAIYPDTGEWQTGINKAIELFANDWKRWGVLEADVKNADIKIFNDQVALVALTATVTKSIENGFGRSNEKNMTRCLKRLSNLVNDKTKSTRIKLFTAIWDVGTVLKNTELGETFVWPIRISMVLVKKKGKWKMIQTHFSYPMSGYPPVRIVNGKAIGY